MRCCAAVLSLAVTLSAQTFEVASIKRSGPQSGNVTEGGPGTKDPIRFRYTSATIEDLIVVAYDVEYNQVSSRAPIDRDTFDINAKIPPGATKQQFRTMLQHLLAERFGLRLHREVREITGFALVVAKSGLKIGDGARRADSGAIEGFPEIPGDKPGMRLIETPEGGYFVVRLRARQTPISELARGIHVPGDRPVVDRTELTGKYDFTLEYSYGSGASPGAATPPVPSIFTALQAQLGLRLVSARIPVNILIVDSILSTPIEY